MMRDKEFGVVRATAFGIYAIRVKDAGIFVKDLVGTDNRFTTDEIQENLRGKIGLRIKEVMPELGIPVIDLEAKVTELGTRLRDRLSPEFEGMGIELVEVQVQDIGLPEEVEKAIDKRGAMAAIGNLQAYTQYETASAIRDAANNPGGAAGAGVGLGAGVAMGAQMINAMTGGARGMGGGAGGRRGGAARRFPARSRSTSRSNGQQAGPFDLAALQQQAGERPAHPRLPRLEGRHGAVGQGGRRARARDALRQRASPGSAAAWLMEQSDLQPTRPRQRVRQDLPLHRLRGEALVRAGHARPEVRVLRHGERDRRERRARRGARLRHLPEGPRGQDGGRPEVEEVKCDKCGAEQSMAGHLFAGHCTFCGAAIVSKSYASRRIKPKSIVPFQVNRSARAGELPALGEGPVARAERPEEVRAERRGPHRRVPAVLDLRLPAPRATTRGERGDDYYTTETYTTQNSRGESVTQTRRVKHTRWTPASGHVEHFHDDVLVMASKTPAAGHHRFRDALQPEGARALPAGVRERLPGRGLPGGAAARASRSRSSPSTRPCGPSSAATSAATSSASTRSPRATPT